MDDHLHTLSQRSKLRRADADSLLCFRVGWENEAYAKSTVRELVYQAKKMGKLNMQNLVTAVTSQGAEQTDCCIVGKRALREAGIGGEYGEYPHVVYIRMWRWPDARKEELKHCETCEFGFDLKKNLVCVNPYHYDRISSISDFQTGIVINIEAVSSNVVTGAHSTKTQTSKIPNEASVEPLSFHETVSATKTHSLRTPETNVTLSQTLPKDMFSLSCFQSANAAPPSLTAPTILGASTISSSNGAITFVPSTSSSQVQANVSNVENFLDAGTKSKTESNIPQGSTVHNIVDESTSSNDDYDFCSKTSFSSSSDDGFEMIDYDEEIKEITNVSKSTAVELSLKCLNVSDKDAKKEPTGDGTTITTKPDVTSLINAPGNVLRATDQLPSSADFNHIIDELVDEIPLSQSFDVESCQKVQLVAMANNVTEVIPNTEPENEDLKETNEESEDKIPAFSFKRMMKKYDELQDKHERLKTAFVEACYTTAYDSLEERTKKLQDVMMNLDNIFRDTLGADKKYSSLKSFVVKTRINGNDSGTSSNTSTASSSSSPTSAPYGRKNLTTAMRRKNTPTTSPLKNVIYDVISRAPALQRFVEQRFTSRPQSPATNDGDVAASGRENLSQQPEQVEPIAYDHASDLRLMLKRHMISNRSCSNSSGDVSCEENVAELKEELSKLRSKVKSLNVQLQAQKLDESEKMMLYTNHMREQHISTTNRLTKEKEALSEELASKKAELEKLTKPLEEVSALLDEKDREIAELNDNLLALSAILTSNDKEILALKNEKRNLKRNSDAEKPVQEISPKRCHNNESKAELKEDSITPQHVFDFLCSELEKSYLDETSPQIEATSKEDVPLKNFQIKEDTQPSLGSPQMETLATSFESCQISEKEKAITAKLNGMIAELEEMKITHVKTKSDLEARLENGAKQYAKLCMKYDKLVKNSLQKN